MTTTAETLSLLAERLTPLLERARAASARRAAPVLASLSIELDAAAPPCLAARAHFLWEQPSRRFSLAAFGEAARFVAAGPQRFGDLRRRLQRLAEGAVIGSAPTASGPLPFAHAGFAFDPSHPDNVAWFGFPDAVAVVPRLLFTLSDSRLFLTANVLVDQDTNAAQATADTAGDAGRLLAAAPEAEADETPSRLLDPGSESRLYWNDSVRGLTDGILRGDADKVVLARRVQVESDASFDRGAVLRRLRSRYPECTIFAVRGGEACFLGATPEMLVHLRGRSVRADCLAGSYPRGATDREDRRLGEALLADEKELREHAFVTRSLREALAALCSDIRQPEEPVLRKMANVQHLSTPVEATTDGPRHVLELVERLHPTAATAGLPRGRSLQLIREHEPFSRGWYAGPIGWIDAEGGGEFAVALRSALLRDDVASLYAGCGIVAGSDPDREYEESGLKLQAMLWALNATSSEPQSPSPLGRGQG